MRYMKKSIIFFALLSATIAQGMEAEKEPVHYFLSTNQLSLYSEDTKKVAKMPRALFKQLCVQAAKGGHGGYFDRVVEKLRLRKIKPHSPQVEIYITPTDLACLLINIPTDNSYSLINGKKAKLAIVPYETEEDKEEEQLIEAFKITGCKYDEAGDFFYKERNPSPVPQTLALALNDLKKSGLELTSDYNFESDQTHHRQIIEQFNKLMVFE
jgi:hypothetical protein